MTPYSIQRPISARSFTVIVCGIFFFSLLVSWFLTVKRHDYPFTKQSLPSLSQCANFEPERTIIAMGDTTSACGFLLIAYWRFLFVAVLLRTTLTSNINAGPPTTYNANRQIDSGHQMRLVNTVAFLLGVANCIEMILVACFDSRDFPSFHTNMAYVFFGNAVLFQMAHTYVQRAVQPTITRIELRSNVVRRRIPILSWKHAKLILTIFTTLFAFITLITKLSNVEYGTVAVFEYLLMFSMLLYWFSFSSDFRLFRASLVAKVGTHSADRVVHVEDV